LSARAAEARMASGFRLTISRARSGNGPVPSANRCDGLPLDIPHFA
jgi:hypothetical protein